MFDDEQDVAVELVEMMEYAREAREALETFVPMVFYRTVGDLPIVAFVGVEGSIEDAVGQVLGLLREKHGPADLIAVAADMYSRVSDAPVVAGSLAEAFSDGDPDVVEQIGMQMVQRGSPALSVRQVYRYHVVDGYEWDPLTVVQGFERSLVPLLEQAVGS
jgi:hypothetical protein